MEPQVQDMQDTVAAVANSLAKGRKCSLRPLSSGNSDSEVYILEILGSRSKNTPENLPKSGRYVLKVTRSEMTPKMTDTDAQETAKLLSENAEYEVVPELIDISQHVVHGKHFFAELFEIAGKNLDVISAPVTKMDERVFRILPDFFPRMYASWAGKDVDPDKASPSELLRKWNGYRSDRTKAAPLHKFVQDIFGGKSIGRYLDHVLVNPLELESLLESISAPEIATVSGFLHRDLHSQNLLFEYSKTNPKYWVIDFALSRVGPIGFDQSYFQISQLLINLNGLKAGTLLSVLESHYRGLGGPIDIPEFAWVSRFLKSCDDENDTWIANHFPNWTTDLTKQLLLSKVAAGINWANKPIGDEAKLIAALYASYHATMFMKNYHEATWEELIQRDDTEVGKQEAENGISDEDWAQVWDLAGGFNSKDYRYVLIAEPQRNIDQLESLGRLPWDLGSGLIEFQSQ